MEKMRSFGKFVVDEKLVLYRLALSHSIESVHSSQLGLTWLRLGEEISKQNSACGI